MFNAEENKRKEQKILADMQRLVQQTIGGLRTDDDEDKASGMDLESGLESDESDF